MDYQKAQQDLDKLKNMLVKYQTLFEEDGHVDTQEQRRLDQLQASIDRAEAAIQEQTGNKGVGVSPRSRNKPNEEEQTTPRSDRETTTDDSPEEEEQVDNTRSETETTTDDSPNREEQVDDTSTEEQSSSMSERDPNLRLGVLEESMPPVEVEDISNETAEAQTQRLTADFTLLLRTKETIDRYIADNLGARRSSPQEMTKVYELEGRLNTFRVQYGQATSEVQTAFSEQRAQVDTWSEETQELLSRLQGDPRARPRHEDSTYDTSIIEAFVLGEGDTNEIDPNDVQQGSLGNCFFMAAIASVAQNNPSRLRELIKDNGDGTYDIKLFVLRENVSTVPKPVIIRVTNEMFSGRYRDMLYAGGGDGELWVALLEKAFATYMGGYEALNLGRAETGMETITGINSDTHSFSDKSEEEIMTLLQEADNNNKEVVLGTSPAGGGIESSIELASGQTLSSSHAYSLISIGSNGIIELRNPYGRSHVSVTISELKEHFGYMAISD